MPEGTDITLFFNISTLSFSIFWHTKNVAKFQKSSKKQYWLDTNSVFVSQFPATFQPDQYENQGHIHHSKKKEMNTLVGN